MPTDASFVSTSMNRFVYTDNGVIYGVGGIRFLPNLTNKGVIWKTTNFGNNWGYQQPDTAIPIAVYSTIDFIDTNTGWAYNGNGNRGVYTTAGGGQIIFTSINQTSLNIPNEYRLYQNYPNPFNSSTNFKFQIPKSGYVKIVIYDMIGREIKTEINDYLYAGAYKINFDAGSLSSGVYFFKLITEEYSNTKKMVLIK